MNIDPLPTELIALENRLRGRTRARLPGGMRDRVLASVAEANSQRRAPARDQWDVWSWAAIAAAVLIAMNLSMICASQAEYSMRAVPNANQVNAELHALQLIESQQEGIFK
jgi:hypothetical protein